MGDPNQIFNVATSDPLGPYRRQEERFQDVGGTKMATRELYTELIGPDGIRQICVQTQYLCQSCGDMFVLIGQNGSVADNIIMCEQCVRSARWRYLLKPLWGLFIKAEGK